MLNKNEYDLKDLEKILKFLPGMSYQCLYDQDFTMKFVSAGCKDLTGYNSDQIIDNNNISYGDIISDEYKALVWKKVTEGVKNRNPYTVEYKIRKKDGSISWVWEQGRAIYDKDGNTKYLLGFITSIDGMKEKNRELKKIKNRLELAVQGANLGIWDWNIKTGKINFNENWSRMLGYNHQEIAPNIESWEELIHQEDKDKVQKTLKRHLEGETKYYSVDHRLKTKSGNYKWIKDIGKVLKKDEKDDPLRAVGVHLDIDETKKTERKLRESEKKFRTYIKNAPVGIFVIDNKGNFKEVNKQACELTGYEKDELFKKTIFELSTRKEKVTNYFFKKFKKDKIIELEDQFIRNNGRMFYARVNGIVIDQNSLLVFAEDIDKKIKMRNRLKRQKAYFEQLFNESTEGIVLLNNKGIILKVNQHFLKMFEYRRDEAIGTNIDQLITPKKKKEEGKYFTNQVMDGIDIKEESIRQTKLGEKIYVSIHAFPIKLDQGQIGIYGIYNNITERKREEEKRRFLSFHDQLTGLYNRRYFENEMERLDNSRKTPICVIIADIDSLKEVNDLFGHKQGDRHIKRAAEVFSELMREEDIVARIGGDEFAVLLPETNTKNAKTIIKRIKSKISESNNDFNRYLSISIGYSVRKKEGTKLEEILKKADEMMYHKKRQKKQN